MREIKFRAWDKINSDMIYSHEHNGLVITLDGDIRAYHLRKDEMVSCKEHVILMQYTGLKDKNDKEIYEGDLLQADDDKEVFFEVKWDSGCFWAWQDTYLSHKSDNCFIIGNIYENPELFKKVRHFPVYYE